MPLPDFLCIGAQKAGTSWLDSMLRQNDAVFLPPIKEIHFFDFLYIPQHKKWVKGAFRKDAAKIVEKRPKMKAYTDRLEEIPRRKDAWYSAVFDLPQAEGRMRGEITPAYSILPEEGIAHVQRINPEMKILFILRDPVDRALSQLRMTANRNNWSSVDAARMEGVDLDGILARSAYRDNIARWEAVFPAEQLLYMPYSHIRTEPEAFLKQVETFLGIGAGAYQRSGRTVHQTQPVDIAKDIETMFEDRLREERAFLADRFGAAYVRAA